VQRAIQHIFARAKHGKPCGILAPVEADARRYLEWEPRCRRQRPRRIPLGHAEIADALKITIIEEKIMTLKVGFIGLGSWVNQ
jgi:hypothetical protein